MLWYPIIVPDWFLTTGDAAKRIRYVASGIPGPDARPGAKAKKAKRKRDWEEKTIRRRSQNRGVVSDAGQSKA